MEIKKFTLLNENKLWYKTISQFLNWLSNKSSQKFIVIDSETTGLLGPKLDQITQISGIVIEYNYSSNSFKEIDTFNKKIKLTDDIKSKMNLPTSRIKKVLSFNHYGDNKSKYYNEDETLKEFSNWISEYKDAILIIQNAQFDMRMINVRTKFKLKNEVLDTKDIIQLYYLPALQKISETNKIFKKMIEKIGTSDRDNGLISSSMSKIGPALNLDMNNYHDALTDCRITISMFKEIIKFLKENQDIDISKYQLERIKTKF